jgi:hypothetical protein
VPLTTPVAASTVLAPALDAGRGEVALEVVVSGRYAAYLTGPNDTLLVVANPRAAVPPCSLVLPRSVRPDDLLLAGTRVVTGPGGLTWPGHRLAVRRWWEPADVRPRQGAEPHPDADTHDLLRGMLRDVPDSDPASLRARTVGGLAARALSEGDGARAARLLCEVLGLGPGLTPSGDDVTAGLLLMSRALVVAGSGRRYLELELLCRNVSAASRHRTTVVSGARLREAAQGRAASPAVRAARLLAGTLPGETTAGTRARARTVFEELLAIGHHSGPDLATGMLAAADAAVTAPTTVPMYALNDRPTAITARRSA